MAQTQKALMLKVEELSALITVQHIKLTTQSEAMDA